MIVRILLFARARDLAGTDVVAIELPNGACLGDLRLSLAKQHPRLAALLERSALAVNDEFADDVTTLSAGAEVALLPPVSGG